MRFFRKNNSNDLFDGDLLIDPSFIEHNGKILSLKEASDISGYHRDYLGQLVRNDQLRGFKKGGSWYTTQKDVYNYLADKKPDHLIRLVEEGEFDDLKPAAPEGAEPAEEFFVPVEDPAPQVVQDIDPEDGPVEGAASGGEGEVPGPKEQKGNAKRLGKKKLLSRITGGRNSLIMIATIASLAAFVVVGLFWFLNRSPEGTQAPTAEDLEIISVAFSELGSISTDVSPQEIRINSALQINGPLVVSDNERPSDPQRGQVYFDQGDSQVYIYDGTEWSAFFVEGPEFFDEFVTAADLAGLATDADVAALTGELAGKVDLAPGLAGTAQLGNINITGTVLAGSFSGNSASLLGASGGAASELLLLDNTDTSTVQPIAINIQSTGAGIGTGIDLSSSGISTAIALGENSISVGGAAIESSEFALLDGRSGTLIDSNNVGDFTIAGIQEDRGLELSAEGEAGLLSSCTTGELLKWNGTSWECDIDIDTTGGGSNDTLQTAYGRGSTILTTDARDIAFDLADTATDSNFIVDIQGTNNIFQIQDSGTGIFTVSDGGATAINGTLDVTGISTLTGFTSTGDIDAAGAQILGASPFVFEGATDDDITTIFAITDPTGSNKTITFPDASGEVSLLGQLINTAEIEDSAVTNTKLANDSITVTAGSGLITGGTAALGSAITLDIASANGGITVNANDIALTLAASADALSATTSSGSGLEVLASGTTLLQGCADNEVLKWDETSDVWACNVDVGAGSTSLQAAYDVGNTITTTDARDIFFTLDDTATDSNFDIDIADGSTSTVSISRLNGAGTADPSQLLLLENLDTDRSIADGLLITAAGGGLADGLDVSDAEITNAVNIGANSILTSATTISSAELDILDAGITLGTETNGDYVASFTAGNGLTGDATGEGSTPTLDIASANGGITVNANDIALTLAASADALSATTSSGSGLEVLASGTTLLQGCADNEVLKWDETSDVWGCNADAGGSNVFTTINAPAGTDPVADSVTDTLNLAATGTNLTITGDETTDTLTFDISESTLAGVGLVVNGDALDVATGNGIQIDTDAVALGTLTADWNQVGAFDIVLNNSDSELQILDSDGTHSTTIDVGNLTNSATYRFVDPAGGAGTYDICTSDGNCTGAGGAAPSDAQYLTLALDADLTNERVLNPGASLTITDNGANGNYDIDTIQDIRTTAAPSFAGLTLGNDTTPTLGSITLHDNTGANTFTGTLQTASSLSGSRTYTLPDEGGTVCLQNSPNCGFAAGNNSFVQDGNSFGELAILGTNDSFGLAFEIDEITRWLINTSGHFVPNSSDTFDIGSSTARVRDLYLGPSTLHIGADADESQITFNTANDLLTFQNSTNSTTGFQFLDANGGIPILNIDTTNERIGFGTATPSEMLTIGSLGNILLEGGHVSTPFGGTGRYENHITYSEQFDNANWSKSGVTITANNTTAPDGTNTADRVVDDITGGGTISQQNIAAGASETWTFSMWIKDDSTSNNISIAIIDNGAPTSATTIIDPTTRWKRYEVEHTTSAGTTDIDVIINHDSVSNDAFFAWGAQLEKQSDKGIYVRTGGTAITTTQRGLVAQSSGGHLFQTSTDSTTGLQVFDAEGGAPIFNVDTTNERVGIGTNAPAYALHVNSVNTPDSTLIARFDRGSANDVLDIDMTGGGVFLNAGSGLGTGMTFTTNNSTAGFIFRTSGPTERFRIDSNGFVGVGPNSPSSHLEINGNVTANAWSTQGIAFDVDAATFTDDSTAGSGTAAEAVFNSFQIPTLAATNTGVTTTDASTVYIAGAPTAGTNQTITNAYSFWVDAGNARFDGRVTVDATTGSSTTGLCWSGTAGSAQLEDCNGAPTDLAENFGAEDASIEAGDIVVSAGEAEQTEVNGLKTSKAYIERSSSPYQANVLGVISTSPNQTYGTDGLFDDSENPQPVSLAGRVPVKVSKENGSIKPGDYITASSVPGVGMKATKTGRVIGIALGSFNSVGGFDIEDPTIGKVVVFVNPTWYVSETALTAAPEPVSGGAITGLAAKTIDGIRNFVFDGVVATRQAFVTVFDVSEERLSGLRSALYQAFGGAEAEVIAENSILESEEKEGGSLEAKTYSVQSSRNEIIVSGGGKAKACETHNIDCNGATSFIRGEGSEGDIEPATIISINLFDPAFTSLLDSSAPVRVVITPTSETQGNLYVKEKSTRGFLVESTSAEDAGAEFDWIVVARLGSGQKDNIEESINDNNIIADPETAFSEDSEYDPADGGWGPSEEPEGYVSPFSEKEQKEEEPVNQDNSNEDSGDEETLPEDDDAATDTETNNNQQ